MNPTSADRSRFGRTQFYESMADQLLMFRNRRDELVAGLHEITDRRKDLPSLGLQDKFSDGSTGPLRDICPFTTMGIFNRMYKDSNRISIAGELANLLGVDEEVPDSFDGVPLLSPAQAWFFPYEKDRQSDDIDILWEVFARAIEFADKPDDINARSTFITAYDKAIGVRYVKWNITMGLYWIRRWHFPTLDKQSRGYIKKKFNIPIKSKGCNAEDYLQIRNALEDCFQEHDYPVHSFPELSQAARNKRGPDHPDKSKEEPLEYPKEKTPPDLITPYSIDGIIEDGCFMDREALEDMLELLRDKKNLILQGPPGTGKTWLAKRLAFALMGKCDDSKVRAVQFHPNLSYEDFIRGWRPTGDGKLKLTDGPFMRMVEDAMKNSESERIIVIEEINRGNPVQILGEMLTLLEAGKRNKREALELSYGGSGDERVFIPANLYVIGTMNLADRSLALVDLALRRRFAFFNMDPAFNASWRRWGIRHGIEENILRDIEERVNDLNETIAQDDELGPQFKVGHSYVTPRERISDGKAWFRRVVESEIGPLLDEYWFDAKEKAEDEKNRLLQGF